MGALPKLLLKHKSPPYQIIDTINSNINHWLLKLVLDVKETILYLPFTSNEINKIPYHISRIVGRVTMQLRNLHEKG